MSDNNLKYRWLSKYFPKSTEKRLVVITGARQTGKTTMVKRFYPDLRYINLDAPENREAIRNIRSSRWGAEVGAAVLDEAQKEVSLFDKIKFSYDSDQITFSVLLGSAQILLLHKIRESLAGRVFLYELWPLMLSELLIPADATNPRMPLLETMLNSFSIDQSLSGHSSVLLEDEDAPKKSMENWLMQWGGMPALLHLKDSEEKKKWLGSYAYTYLERDVMDLARIRDLEPFIKFQRLSALRSAKILNYSDLAKDAGISVDSSRRYFEYLKLSYQVILLQPYYENLTSTVIKSPKLYLVDIGLLRQLAGITAEISGEIYETYVVSEIYKWVKSNQKSCELYFYRTRSGLEVDLLIKTEKGIIALEVKSGEKITSSDFRPMQEIAQKLGDRFLGGLVVYRGSKIEKAAPGIWLVPSHRLLS